MHGEEDDDEDGDVGEAVGQVKRDLGEAKDENEERTAFAIRDVTS